MLLTDALLLDYKRCQRRAFLNCYGDIYQKDPEKDFLRKLREESQAHIATILAEDYPHFQQPLSDNQDWLSQAQATELLMKQGVSCIYKGVLLKENSETGLDLLGRPQLLVKSPGESKFGDWVYVPISIQLGKRAKPEYKLIATFYAYLLLLIQETLPPKAEIILRRHNHHFVDLTQWLERLQETLSQCWQILGQSQEPEVFISRQRCNLCPWYSHCYVIAQSQQHLSLVPGVTPNRYESLQSMGVMTVESLAKACPINIEEVMGKETASTLQKQAQALLDNRPIRKTTRIAHLSQFLPAADVEFYFDIEAEPERNLDYLLGILRVNHRDNSKQFYGFLAKTPAEEKEIWQQFLSLVNSDENSPIYHFSDYEVETIKRLAHLYHTPPAMIERLTARCVDLHQRVISTVILPVENYSLKSLANWVGFQWRDAGVGGDQCVCWYDQWLKTGDRTLLESILRYNEDDCRATYFLKNWLSAFLTTS